MDHKSPLQYFDVVKNSKRHFKSILCFEFYSKQLILHANFIINSQHFVHVLQTLFTRYLL